MKLIYAWALLAAAATAFGQDSSLPNYRISSPEDPNQDQSERPRRGARKQEPKPRPQEPALSHDARIGGVSIGPRGLYMADTELTWEDGSFFAGAAVRAHFMEFISIEVIGAWNHHEGSAFTRNIVPLQVSALLFFMGPGQFEPYILGGYGWYFTHIRYDSGAPDDHQTNQGWHAGAGIDVLFSRNISFSVDGRYVWLQNKTDMIPGLGGERFWMLTAGVNFEF